MLFHHTRRTWYASNLSLLLSHSFQTTAVIIKEKYNGDSNLRMNYNNYERNIVEWYGVALVGRPDNLLPVRNPSSVGGREVLQPLLNALLTQTCHWIRLTEVQLAKRIEDNGVRQAKGEAVYKPQKKRQVAAIKGAIQENNDGDGTDDIENRDEADSGGNGDNGDNQWRD